MRITRKELRRLISESLMNESDNERVLEQLKVSMRDWFSQEQEFRNWVKRSAKVWKRMGFTPITENMINIIFPKTSRGTKYSKMQFDNYSSDNIDDILNPVVVSVRNCNKIVKQIETA